MEKTELKTYLKKSLLWGTLILGVPIVVPMVLVSIYCSNLAVFIYLIGLLVGGIQTDVYRKVM